MAHSEKGIVQQRDGLHQQGSSMKKDKESKLTNIYGPFAGAAAIKGIERSIASVKNRRDDFKSYDEIMDYYKDTKPGDTLYFQETFMGGKGHPIIVLDGKSDYYWPTGDAYKAGIIRPLKVPQTPEHIALGRAAKANPALGQDHIKKILSEKGLDINPEAFWGEPYRGKFFEVRAAQPGSGVNPVEIGSLEAKLKEAGTIKKRVKGTNNQWVESFSPVAARRLAGVYRSAGEVDSTRLSNNAEELLEKGRKGNVRYTVFAKKFDWDAPCTKGHCLLGADELLRRSGFKRGKPAITPGMMAENLVEVLPPKTKATGKINMLAPMLVGAGLVNTYTGNKEDNARKATVGMGVIGAGVGLNAITPVKDALSSLGGIVNRTLGGFIMEQPVKAIDKYRSRGGRYIPERETKIFALKEWFNRHPQGAGRVGALALGIPASYGLYKGIQKLNGPEPKRKRRFM